MNDCNFSTTRNSSSDLLATASSRGSFVYCEWCSWEGEMERRHPILPSLSVPLAGEWRGGSWCAVEWGPPFARCFSLHLTDDNLWGLERDNRVVRYSRERGKRCSGLSSIHYCLLLRPIDEGSGVWSAEEWGDLILLQTHALPLAGDSLRGSENRRIDCRDRGSGTHFSPCSKDDWPARL